VGYKIAQRDLMIRGAGDILGPEQAGYIDTVVIDLYMKMLNNAVQGKKEELDEIKPNKLFSIQAYIPQNYAEKSDKIELYQDIENAKNNAELSLIKKKMRDIYGKIPNDVETLFTKRKIDLLLENDAIKDINEYGNSIDLILSDGFGKINGIGSVLFDELVPFLEDIKVTYLNHELKIRLNKGDDWLDKLEKIIAKIVKLYNSSVIH
jgi:transcription-repair coupling factor (superfamily II helicase)